jgi:uncharacterized protein YukE
VGDLRVDYAMLHDLQRALSDVAERLEGVRAEARLAGPAWGGRAVANSMGDFVDNWDAHREKVASAVKELAGDCKGVAATFQAIEAGLSRAAVGDSEAAP